MSVNTIVNANVYLDGTNDLIGKVEKVTLVEIEPTMEGMAGLGMISELDVPTGLKKMMMKLSWKSFYPDALKHRLNFFKTVSIQVRGSLETYDQMGRVAEEPAVIIARVQFTKATLGVIERAKPISNMEDDMQVIQMELKVGGVTRMNYDLFKGEFGPDDENLFGQTQANLGRA